MQSNFNKFNNYPKNSINTNKKPKIKNLFYLYTKGLEIKPFVYDRNKYLSASPLDRQST
ncbi:hypothetical protein M153_1510009410 [Pseudoloma neurophilia]|uniref:Uncharacterized protein n=1 Tax=Pseudoloma neurophilia TaxID=146866 RepID=A0A0R0M6M6_9MICR|nr:hypothetical protein M153_1510009410 [Pseudoloma neurophilia]